MSEAKLRLVAVVAQFQFVVDDGDTLTDLVLADEKGNPSSPTVRIAAKDWPAYAQTQYLEAVADLERQVNEQTERPTASNSSARRARPVKT
jgi:hypothetical protein